MSDTASNPIFDLSGKVAVITGSSRGIGRAIAAEMAKAGARVVISSRKPEACEKVAQAINEEHGEVRALAVPANISETRALENLVQGVADTWGDIDILVCNAASNPYYGPITDIPDEVFRKILDNNVVANNRLIGLVAPGMRKKRQGVVLIVSSIGGLVGSGTIGAYNVSKAADMQLARNLAMELGSDNIRVNCIAPGLIKTDFSRALWENPETMAHLNKVTPLGRAGDVSEIAGTAVFLASPAGGYITGQTIVVDGGVTIFGF